MRIAILCSAAIGLVAPAVAQAERVAPPTLKPRVALLPLCRGAAMADSRPCGLAGEMVTAERRIEPPRYLPGELRYRSDPDDDDMKVQLRWLKVTASARF